MLRRRVLIPFIVAVLLIVGCTSTTVDDRPPVPLVQVQPSYPFELKRAGVKGYAVIEYIIDASGNVTKAQVLETNHPLFGQAAMNAVFRWKFSPGTKNGRPVNTRAEQKIEFDLTEDPAPVKK